MQRLYPLKCANAQKRIRFCMVQVLVNFMAETLSWLKKKAKNEDIFYEDKTIFFR